MSTIQVLRLPELIAHILRYVDAEDLFNAFQVVAPFTTFFHDKLFWQKKLKFHGYLAVDKNVDELCDIYQHRVRTVEARNRDDTPLRKSSEMEEKDDDNTYAIYAGGKLLLSSNKTSGLIDITDLKTILHEDRPKFQPASVYANGRLCIGRENDDEEVCG